MLMLYILIKHLNGTISVKKREGVSKDCSGRF